MSYHFDIHENISNIPKSLIENNISNIHENGLRVYLMTTLSNQNYMSIEKNCSDAYQMGADGIIFNNYLLQGNAINDRNIILNDNQLKIVALEIEKVRLKYD